MTRARSLTGPPAVPDTDPGTDWRQSANCIGHEALHDAAMPSQPWGPPMDRDAAHAATSLCIACPARAECKAKLDDDPWVIAGGTTPQQRHRANSGAGCDDCGKVFETSMALSVHRTKVHPRTCPACGKACRSERAVSMHWATTHREETGTCIRGHKVAPTGLCRECKADKDRTGREARQQRAERAAALRKGAAA